MENTQLTTGIGNFPMKDYDKNSFETSFKINYSSFENEGARFRVSSSDFEHITNIFTLKDYFKDTAIQNLIKKTKFLQLYIQLIEEQIDEDEYEQELEGKSDEYFITLKELQSDLDYIALMAALQKLPKSLSIDDVSEIFGIQHESLCNRILN